MASYANRHKIPLQHHSHRIARRAGAGFVSGYDPVFPLSAALLVDEGDLAVVGGFDFLPRAGGALAPLDRVGGDGTAVNGRFPVEEDPSVALIRGIGTRSKTPWKRLLFPPGRALFPPLRILIEPADA